MVNDRLIQVQQVYTLPSTYSKVVLHLAMLSNCFGVCSLNFTMNPPRTFRVSWCAVDYVATIQYSSTS